MNSRRWRQFSAAVRISPRKYRLHVHRDDGRRGPLDRVEEAQQADFQKLELVMMVQVESRPIDARRLADRIDPQRIEAPLCNEVHERIPERCLRAFESRILLLLRHFRLLRLLYDNFCDIVEHHLPRSSYVPRREEDEHGCHSLHVVSRSPASEHG